MGARVAPRSITNPGSVHPIALSGASASRSFQRASPHVISAGNMSEPGGDRPLITACDPSLLLWVIVESPGVASNLHRKQVRVPSNIASPQFGARTTDPSCQEQAPFVNRALVRLLGADSIFRAEPGQPCLDVNCRGPSGTQRVGISRAVCSQFSLTTSAARGSAFAALHVNTQPMGPKLSTSLNRPLVGKVRWIALQREPAARHLRSLAPYPLSPLGPWQ